MISDLDLSIQIFTLCLEVISIEQQTSHKHTIHLFLHLCTLSFE